MKSHLPYRGLTSPQLSAALRPVLADPGLRMASREEWEATIRALWDEAAYREEWYAAIALARHRLYRGWVDSASMALWRDLVVSGGWWDVVDDIATHLVRDVRLANPEVEGLRLREWAVGDEVWLRRTAILAQVGAGPGWTGLCSSTPSSPTSATGTSSSARRSAGPCATTPAWRPTGCEASSTATRATSPGCRGGRR